MHKCLFLLVFFVATQTSNVFAQHHRGEHDYEPTTTHNYYICISGLTRAGLQDLENSIQKKSGVTYFLGDKYPVRYFLLKSNNPVSREQFTSWIDAGLYKVVYYGEGIYSKEGAVGVGKKLVNSQNLQ